MNNYVCVGCKRIVEVPMHMILNARQKMAIAASMCSDCFRDEVNLDRPGRL